MKIQTYTPTEAMVVALQWPGNPTEKDFNDLKHWVGDDRNIRVECSGTTCLVMFCGEILLPGDYIARNDDQYTIYSQQTFEDAFMEVK